MMMKKAKMKLLNLIQILLFVNIMSIVGISLMIIFQIDPANIMTRFAALVGLTITFDIGMYFYLKVKNS